MITNYYTIYALVKELRRQLKGEKIIHLYTQEKNTLIITFSHTVQALVISCEPSQNAMYLTPKHSRAKRNTVDVCTVAAGNTIAEITIAQESREVVFFLENSLKLVVQLYAVKANVYVIDENNRILDAFLKKEEYKGSEFCLNAPATSEEQLLMKHEEITSSDESITVSQALKKYYLRFGNTLIQEVLFRSSIDENLLLKDISPDQLNVLNNELKSIHMELTHSENSCIIYKNREPLLFSIIPLQMYKDCTIQKFNTISEGIKTFLQITKSFDREYELRKQVVQKLSREKQHLEKALTVLQQQRVELPLADQLELYGKLILSALHCIVKGQTTITLDNAITSNPPAVTIELDPHLSPQKNADRYFAKAKKARRTLQELTERENELLQQLQEVKQLLSELESVQSVEEYLKQKEAILKKYHISNKSNSEKAIEQQLPFRVFTVTGGFTVLAGKSSENNDLLSTRYTAKDDLWFHAHGVGGSHVVLKVHSAKGEVPKQAILEAASIAAYYSKMKNASMVPVTMCEGKYVRKPKGAPPGTVVVEREKTLFVDPHLPEEKRK